MAAVPVRPRERPEQRRRMIRPRMGLPPLDRRPVIRRGRGVPAGREDGLWGRLHPVPHGSAFEHLPAHPLADRHLYQPEHRPQQEGHARITVHRVLEPLGQVIADLAQVPVPGLVVPPGQKRLRVWEGLVQGSELQLPALEGGTHLRASAPAISSEISLVIFACRARLYCRVMFLIRSAAFSVAAFMATRRAICSLTAASRKHLNSRCLNATGTMASRISVAFGMNS